MAEEAPGIGGVGARRSIGIALVLLGGVLAALFAVQAVLAWREYAQSRDIVVADRISKSIAESITHLGVVRGFAMTYLIRAEPAAAPDLAIVERRYRSGVGLLSAARPDLAAFRPELAAGLEAILARAGDGWERAQRQMRMPGATRDAAFSQGWFGAYSTVIGDLERLLVEMRSPSRLQDLHFAFLADLRIAILRWRLLRTREMGTVGARVAGELPGNSALVADIDALRGRADTLFAQIHLHVGSLRSDMLRGALGEVEGALAPLNLAFEQAREAWRAERPAPITLAEHDRLTLAAIDSINRLIAAISDATQRYAADLEAEALMRTLGSFALLAAGLVLAFLSWRMVARAVIEPLEVLSDVARRIAGGDRAARVPERGAAEIQQAAGQFNLMLDTMQQSQRDLERSNEALDRGHQEIAARERRLHAITDNLPAFIAHLDREMRLQFVNQAAERWLGASAAALSGKRAVEVMPDGPWPAVAGMREPEGAPHATVSGQSTAVYPDGTKRDVEFTFVPDIEADGRIAGHFVLAINVTERRHAEEQLRHSQKIEAIGKLTGGVAHDFNNLLAVICGNLELLAEGLDDRPELQDLARKAIRAGDRGATLTRSLLAFARRQILLPSAIDLNRLVAEMSDLVHRTMPETIDVRIVQGGDLWRCEADVGQLQNALLNLVVNARDAMPERGGLVIETANADLTEDYAAAHAEIDPGEYVMLAVSDTGVGMPPEVAARAFEPFFTTKELAKGTGLGLSMVYGFAKQSNGHVKIYSEVGVGTTVKLYLPRSLAEAESLPQPVPDRPAMGIEKVLVVEDEPDVLTLLFALLRSLGYAVEEARNGAAALRVLEAHQDIALLLTDVVLPGEINGPQLAARARALRPGLHVVFMSGYTENAMLQHGHPAGGARLLQKPFTKADLAAAVRAALDREVAA